MPITLPCGCEIDHPMGGEPEIVFCKKHGAVDDMIEALKAMLGNVGPCKCAEAYLCRDLKDPDCTFHNFQPEVEQALAALRKAGIEP